jgi:SAM-dependent methyltransferase
LDIGSGNKSASKLTSTFPQCHYYGLDIDKLYNYDVSDFKRMKNFFEIDLATLNFDELPNQFFDAIWMVHVLEHLPNGESVIAGLLRKLKPGGYFYLEYPGRKSTTLPSMYGTLNFYDDPTHVRLYDVDELAQVFEQNGCIVISKGTRRNWLYLAAMPFRLLLCLIRWKRVEANIFWDLLGFAEFLLVRKNKG